MNPQYMPQPNYGQSNLPNPQGLQNVPLGPPKPGQMQNGPPFPPGPQATMPGQQILGSGPPSNTGFPEGPMGKSNITENQRPPNQFGQQNFPGGPPQNGTYTNGSSSEPSMGGMPPMRNGPPQSGPGPLQDSNKPFGAPPANQLPPNSVSPSGGNSRPVSNMPPGPTGQGFPNQGQNLANPSQPNQQWQNKSQGFGGPMGQPPITNHQQNSVPPNIQPALNHPPNPMASQSHLPGQQQQFPGQPPRPGQPPMSAIAQPGQQAFPGQPPLSSRPPMPGQVQNQSFSQTNRSTMPGQPPLPSPLPGQPPLPGQQQMPGQQQIPGQPPLPGQQHMSGQPPMNQPGQYNQNQPGNPMNQPPLPGQNYPPGNQNLSNQMQNMSIGGSCLPPPPGRYPPGAQYPGPQINGGDNGPHMPPPINQQSQNYMNGHPQQRTAQSPLGYLPPGQYAGPQTGAYPPPQPGFPQQQPGFPQQPGYPQQPSYPQQPQQKLDPELMPSPIQVALSDQETRKGAFVTNQKGLVPPLVSTKFYVQDQGNCSPRYTRSTMYNIPTTQDIMKQTQVPFSLVISPMARTVEQEFPPPIVNFGDLGPVRCIRCKAYICPYMQFVDAGRRFQCPFCRATTDVPSEYFQHLDHTGQRMDRFERPELVLGTYEFVATQDYCRDNKLPKPPAMIFVIEVSYNSIKSGMVHLLCSQMKEIIQNLPIDQGHEKSNMKIGFITYNSTVHFYNIKGTLAAPQMLIVGDTQEMFMPLLDGFLCTPEESGPIIDTLMQQIPEMFGNTRETETILLPAITAGLEALKASECAGKLLVFHSSLPTAEAPGKLKPRDDRKLLGTDKERTVLTPQNQVYNQLGQDCVGVGCSVDMFLFNNAYIDIATIGQVPRLTGGEIFKYTYFQADVDGDRLIRDIIIDISRPIAFDAIMRVRTSTGVRPTDFYGHFFMSNTTDIELAAVDCDKAIAVEIKHDDKLNEEDGVYVQSALLYTSCSGQRRLRIMNLSLKTTAQMADLYRACDLDTIINYIAKQSVYKLFDHNPKAVKDAIVNRASHILAMYRKHCAAPSSAGQLILPDCMKLLPLYINCLLKSDALSGGSEMTLDDRSFVMQTVLTMDVLTSVNHFYPKLIPLHQLDPDKDEDIPAPIRCSFDKIQEDGVYLLVNGVHMFLWIGLGAKPEFIQNVFGVPSAIQVNIDQVHLPELDNPLSIAIRNIIEEIRLESHRCMRLTMVRQREKLEPVFKHFLVEDRGSDGTASYLDFLCHMHKEIRAILS